MERALVAAAKVKPATLHDSHKGAPLINQLALTLDARGQGSAVSPVAGCEAGRTLHHHPGQRQAARSSTV